MTPASLLVRFPIQFSLRAHATQNVYPFFGYFVVGSLCASPYFPYVFMLKSKSVFLVNFCKKEGPPLVVHVFISSSVRLETVNNT